MLKKSILTPVLSGVLAVSVVGSGAYYFVNQRSAEKDDSSSESQEADIKKAVDKTADKVSDTVSEVKDSVSDQVDTIEKAMAGELDFSYNASLTFTPGEALTEQADIKSIALTASAKQKGDASQLTLAGLYDGKTLASANVIADRASGNLYAQVPELSSAYVSASGEQLKSMIQQSIEAPLKAYTEKAAEAAQQQGADIDVNAAQMPDFNGLIDAIGAIDQDALAEDIEGYIQAAADNFPEGKDKDATKGTVDGVSYELTTKSYTVTVDDAKNIAKAVLERAKDDNIVKDFLDNEAVSTFIDGASSAEYVEGIEGLLGEIEKAEAESDTDGKMLEFDVMFDADGAVAGVNMEIEGGSFYEVITTVDNALVVDVKFDSGNGDSVVTMAGAIKNDNDTLNGSVKIDATTMSYDYEQDKDIPKSTTMVYSLTDVKLSGDAVTGTIGMSVDADGHNVAMSLTSNSTADKTDLLYTASMDSKKMFDIAFVLEQTDASDITIPTDAIAIDLETGAGSDTYAATLDLDGFQANLKSTLGDELYNKMFGAKDYVIDDTTPVTGTLTTTNRA
ncbi:MAG: hypothetical protein IJM75_02455 [Ruminococcus sp.]|nr:hypothetical protein [Ruminococcus sp.]